MDYILHRRTKMKFNKILETDRLVLREFNAGDAEFILTLLNTRGWIEFIGDRNVKTVEDAKTFLETGLIKSYKENGFGLWAAILKNTNTPIGMCGLVNRKSLEDTDIGFALLPEYTLFGYGYEMTRATLNYAHRVLEISKIVAITDPKNISSIKLLEKLGLEFEKIITLSEKDTVQLFSSSNNQINK